MVSQGKSRGKGMKGNPPKFIIIRRPLPPEGNEVKQARREQAAEGERVRNRLAAEKEAVRTAEILRQVKERKAERARAKLLAQQAEQHTIGYRLSMPAQERIDIGGPKCPHTPVLMFDELVPCVSFAPLQVCVIPQFSIGFLGTYIDGKYIRPKQWFVGTILAKFPKRVLIKWADGNSGGLPDDFDPVSKRLVYPSVGKLLSAFPDVNPVKFVDDESKVYPDAVPRYSFIREQWWDQGALAYRYSE